MISRISDGYLNWLMDKVDGEKGYLKLFRALGNREFTWIVDNDRNRASDGLLLRDHYGYFTGLNGQPCTVLEMMVGLSIRVGILTTSMLNHAWIFSWGEITEMTVKEPFLGLTKIIPNPKKDGKLQRCGIRCKVGSTRIFSKIMQKWLKMVKIRPKIPFSHSIITYIF